MVLDSDAIGGVLEHGHELIIGRDDFTAINARRPKNHPTRQPGLRRDPDDAAMIVLFSGDQAGNRGGVICV